MSEGGGQCWVCGLGRSHLVATGHRKGEPCPSGLPRPTDPPALWVLYVPEGDEGDELLTHFRS